MNFKFKNDKLALSNPEQDSEIIDSEQDSEIVTDLKSHLSDISNDIENILDLTFKKWKEEIPEGGEVEFDFQFQLVPHVKIRVRR